MRKLILIPLFFSFMATAFAREAAIYTIDHSDYDVSYVTVSDEALPSDHYAQLVNMISSFRFTPITDQQATQIFETLKKDKQARNKFALGACSTRRQYIQDYLQKMSIQSGKFYINCPKINGHIAMKDRSNNHMYHFANYHDTNVVAVGNVYKVMDVQFEDGPRTLHEYLAEIEASQHIRPLKRQGDTSNLCYWTITGSNGQVFKKAF
ncbi:MAG: hypothetical protein ACJ76H_10715 [Bacteriovoracaceae bacterium]